MKDATLERVWKARAAIARRCQFDARKLVAFYQARQQSAYRHAPDRSTARPHHLRTPSAS